MSIPRKPPDCRDPVQPRPSTPATEAPAFVLSLPLLGLTSKSSHRARRHVYLRLHAIHWLPGRPPALLHPVGEVWPRRREGPVLLGPRLAPGGAAPEAVRQCPLLPSSRPHCRPAVHPRPGPAPSGGCAGAGAGEVASTKHCPSRRNLEGPDPEEGCVRPGRRASGAQGGSEPEVTTPTRPRILRVGLLRLPLGSSQDLPRPREARRRPGTSADSEDVSHRPPPLSLGRPRCAPTDPVHAAWPQRGLPADEA